MEGPISFWGYKQQESNLILPEHDDDDDDITTQYTGYELRIILSVDGTNFQTFLSVLSKPLKYSADDQN